MQRRNHLFWTAKLSANDRGCALRDSVSAELGRFAPWAALCCRDVVAETNACCRLVGRERMTCFLPAAWADSLNMMKYEAPAKAEDATA